MSRADIRMTDEELRRFLSLRRPCIIAARTADGQLVCRVGAGQLHGDFLRLEVDEDPLLIKALRGDGRVACMVEQAPSYFEMLAAVARGYVRDIEIGDGVVRFGVPIDDVVSCDFAKSGPRQQEAARG